jgi:Protein of unknown function DUF262
MEKPERSSYTPLDFLEWKQTKSLELTPKFQRRSVWKSPARGYLIDTLMKGMPVPPIYLRRRQSDDFKRTIREVIDGQQRISAVIDFVEGKYALSKGLSGSSKARKFKDLSTTEQDAIRGYSFICEVISGVSDEEVLQMFARLNTYSVQLSAQELRNGRFFGPFKQTAYTLAFQHVEFWRKNKIFSEQKIARMLEAEFTSELLIAMIGGMQDKKKSIDDFYTKYDEEFPESKSISSRFKATVDQISNTFGDDLAKTAFKRTPLFYSLFCAVYHHSYGLPGEDLDSPHTKLNESQKQGLRDSVLRLSEALTEHEEAVKAGETPQTPKRISLFVTASLRQTDNIQPRKIRFNVIYKGAFQGLH